MEMLNSSQVIINGLLADKTVFCSCGSCLLVSEEDVMHCSSFFLVQHERQWDYWRSRELNFMKNDTNR